MELTNAHKLLYRALRFYDMEIRGICEPLLAIFCLEYTKLEDKYRGFCHISILQLAEHVESMYIRINPRETV